MVRFFRQRSSGSIFARQFRATGHRAVASECSNRFHAITRPNSTLGGCFFRGKKIAHRDNEDERKARENIELGKHPMAVEQRGYEEYRAREREREGIVET